MAGDPSPTKSSRDIGLRLKKLCAEKYKSKTECAHALGMKPQNWNKVEAGKVRFDSEEIYKYADFFNVDPAWLLVGGIRRSGTSQAVSMDAGLGDFTTQEIVRQILEVQGTLGRIAALLLEKQSAGMDVDVDKLQVTLAKLPSVVEEASSAAQ